MNKWFVVITCAVLFGTAAAQDDTIDLGYVLWDSEIASTHVVAAVLMDELGYDVEVRHFPNPRVEAESHYYNAANTKLRDLGLKPHYLGDELLRSILKTIERYKDRVIERAILPTTKWNPGELVAEMPAASEG